jgi:uncharacterized membrane protein YphA (DoxX/SURF4 family)
MLARVERLPNRFSELAYLVLRLGVAFLFIFHAPQKWLGWFGGPAFALISIRSLASLIELVTSPLIALGLFTSWAAFVAAAEMAGAYCIVHWPRPGWPIENRGELQGATSGVMEMCIDNPREGFSNIFDTHPSVDRRVAALVKFAGGHDPGQLGAIPLDLVTSNPGPIDELVFAAFGVDGPQLMHLARGGDLRIVFAEFFARRQCGRCRLARNKDIHSAVGIKGQEPHLGRDGDARDWHFEVGFHRVEGDGRWLLGFAKARERGFDRIDTGRHRLEAEPPVAPARRHAHSLKPGARGLERDAGKQAAGNVANHTLDVACRRLCNGCAAEEQPAPERSESPPQLVADRHGSDLPALGGFYLGSGLG